MSWQASRVLRNTAGYPKHQSIPPIVQVERPWPPWIDCSYLWRPSPQYRDLPVPVLYIFVHSFPALGPHHLSLGVSPAQHHQVSRSAGVDPHQTCLSPVGIFLHSPFLLAAISSGASLVNEKAFPTTALPSRLTYMTLQDLILVGQSQTCHRAARREL